jgi:hypothetical protein
MGAPLATGHRGPKLPVPVLPMDGNALNSRLRSFPLLSSAAAFLGCVVLALARRRGDAPPRIMGWSALPSISWTRGEGFRLLCTVAHPFTLLAGATFPRRDGARTAVIAMAYFSTASLLLLCHPFAGRVTHPPLCTRKLSLRPTSPITGHRTEAARACYEGLLMPGATKPHFHGLRSRAEQSERRHRWSNGVPTVQGGCLQGRLAQSARDTTPVRGRPASRCSD